MKILVTGKNGQLGWELQRSLLVVGDVIALDRNGLDMSRPETVASIVEQVRPDVIVNAAAYTAVDLAEREEVLATDVNGTSVGELAKVARKVGALLIHYSTDYVFDGTATKPIREDALTAPLNAYGRSKLVGERALSREGADWLTLRTAWVYSARAKNFAKTITKASLEREELRVVADQFGTPTSARMLADATSHVIVQAMRERQESRFESGIFHLTAQGETNWHGFAEEIVALARAYRGDEVRTNRVVPIPAAEFAAPARRPSYSVLDGTAFDRRFSIVRPGWKALLPAVMQELTQ